VLSSLLSFAVVAGLITIIPGLDTAMVLRATLVRGRRHGFATALGISTGALFWGAGAAIGVSALLTASTAGYTVVRVAGALYMVWLGVRLLRGSKATAPGPVPERLYRSWRRGVLTNLLNPKIGAFYVAVLPQFIPAHTSHLAMGLLLALVHDLEGAVWFTAIVLGTHTVRGLLARRAARRTIDGVTGATLIGFGIRLAL
jgi:threonine/homoserine/homoserine lactone efflux protein